MTAFSLVDDYGRHSANGLQLLYVLCYVLVAVLVGVEALVGRLLMITIWCLLANASLRYALHPKGTSLLVALQYHSYMSVYNCECVRVCVADIVQNRCSSG